MSALAIFLLVASGFVGFMNFVSCLLTARNRHKGVKRVQPVIPFLSILLSAFAFSLSTGNSKWLFVLLPLVDVGNWVGFSAVAKSMASLVFRKSE